MRSQESSAHRGGKDFILLYFFSSFFCVCCNSIRPAGADQVACRFTAPVLLYIAAQRERLRSIRIEICAAPLRAPLFLAFATQRGISIANSLALSFFSIYKLLNVAPWFYIPEEFFSALQRRSRRISFSLFGRSICSSCPSGVNK